LHRKLEPVSHSTFTRESRKIRWLFADGKVKNPGLESSTHVLGQVPPASQIAEFLGVSEHNRSGSQDPRISHPVILRRLGVS
jgi:hypothetical protein